MAHSTRKVLAGHLSAGRSPKTPLLVFVHLFILLAAAHAADHKGLAAAAGSAAQTEANANDPATGKETDALQLEPGKPIQRELRGGESHSYRLMVAAGQYALVAVDQRRINVVVSAFGPNGEKITEADSFGIGESESVSLIAEKSASYRLEVRSPDKNAPEGTYEIRIKEQRAVTEPDKGLVAAERLIAQGMVLERELTNASWRKAIETYQEAIPPCRLSKYSACEATALYLISNVHVNLGEKQKAFDSANQALPLAQAATKEPDEEKRLVARKVEATVLDTISRIHNEFGDKNEALKLSGRALAIRESCDDRVGKITTLNNMVTSYHAIGDYQKALDLSEQTRKIVTELGDVGKEATVLNNMCVIHNDFGSYKKGLDFCTQALSIRRMLNDRWGEATVLNNMGNSYSGPGEYQKALDLYTQARTAYKLVGSARGEGIALNNVGWAHAILGEYEKAIFFYNEALEIFRAAGDQFREANVLSNIGVNYADLKDFRKAIEIQQRVLQIRRALGNRDGEAVTLNNIAACYSNLGDNQKALDYYNQSVTLHRTIGNPSQLTSALGNIGALYRELGEHQKAAACLNEALQLTQTIGDRKNEAWVLAHIARLERDRGNIAQGRRRIEQALAAVESVRINVKSHQLRASFLASVLNYVELDIDLLMRLHKQEPSAGFDGAAFQASERGRARTLLDLLAEAGAEIRQGVDPSLVEREQVLRQTISDKAARQTRLLSGPYTREQADETAREINSLAAEHDLALAQIRETSPRYAALMQPAPLTLKEIQSTVLDDDTLLLEYALGERKSFLWAVTPKSVSSFELPKRDEIETAARGVYAMATAPHSSVANETQEQRRKRLEQAAVEYPKAVAALSQILLGPVASELKNKRLLIVCEGALQYVPFAALPEPLPAEADRNRQGPAVGADSALNSQSRPLLIVGHEVISLPSASVLAVLRQETARRRTADKVIAVFADPVFDSNDPRVRRPDKSKPAAAERAGDDGDVVRSAAESGLRDLVRLRFSRQEADQIVRLASESKRLEAVDFAANRTAVTSPDLRHYAILHFATHGLINNLHPELSGVVLSLVDEQGRPQNGFLRLYDIYNLKLESDLVVLSACQTAIGKEIKGEGLIGLTRGFMYAGTPRVVASLWQADDRATAELMGRFYDGLLRQGLRPAAALRAAQVSMWKDRRWQAPYYWAAFTLQGEWK